MNALYLHVTNTVQICLGVTGALVSPDTGWLPISSVKVCRKLENNDALMNI